METIWKTKKGNRIIQNADGFFTEDGTEVNMGGETPQDLGWVEDISEPVIETISSPPEGNSIAGTAMAGLNFFTPNKEIFARQARSEWERAFPNSPTLQTAGETIGGFTGLGVDIASALYSPARTGWAAFSPLASKLGTKIAESGIAQGVKNVAGKLNPSVAAPKIDAALDFAKNAIKAGLPRGGAAIPAAKSLPAIGAKNFAMNTADAAIFNNTQNLAEGNDVQFGPAELAGGMLGGAVGTTAEKKVVNDVLRARNAAARNAESINFAEVATGKKGMRAVEQIIDENVAKHGNFTNAVDNLRTETDALNTRMTDFLQKAGLNEIPYSTEKLRKSIDNYVLGKTSFLGNRESRNYARAAGEAYDESLRETLLARMKATTNADTRALSDQVAAMDIAEVTKLVPNLTLDELNRIKVNMQKRSSHWARSQSSMAREGTESLANKEGSAAINSILDDFGASNITSEAMQEWAENNAKMLTPAQAKEFREINRLRHKAIGNLGIMERAERAQAKRDEFVTGIGNAIYDWNAANRNTSTPFLRWMGARGGEYLDENGHLDNLKAGGK